MPPELIVRVVGDSSALERAFRRSSASTKRFEKDVEGSSKRMSVALSGIGRSVALATAGTVGLATLGAALRASSSAASNLNEQTSKTEVVFGQAAASVERFSKVSLGLAQDQALELASTFGALLKPMGLTDKAAADLSIRLTKLGVDFSSFFNTDTADALNAIRSGLVGEVEPLRRYGVLLSAARVQQEALLETGKKHASELTNLETVQARVNLIFRDSKQATGDYGRTIGGLANQQRELQKNIRNLEIGIGGALNPEILKVTKSLNEWLGKSKNQERVQRDVAEAVDIAKAAFAGIVAVIKPAVEVFKELSRAVGGTANAFKILTAALLAFKAAKVLDGLGLIGSTAKTSKGEVNGLRSSLGRLKLLGAIGIPITLLLNKDAIEQFAKDNGFGFLTGPLGPKLFPGEPAVRPSKDPFDTRPDASGRVPAAHFNLTGGPTGQLEAIQASGKAFADGLLEPFRIAQRNVEKLIAQAKAGRGATGPVVGSAFSGSFNVPGLFKANRFPSDKFQLDALRSAGLAKGKLFGGESQFLRASFETSPSNALAQAKAEAQGDTAGLRGAIRRARTAAQKALRSGTLSINAQIEAWNVIKDANDKLKQNIAGDVTKFRHVSSAKLAQALGLQGDAFRRARVAFAVSVPEPSQAFSRAGGGGINFNAPVTNQFYGVTDMRAMEEQLEKRQKSRPQVRRGAR